MLNLLRTRLCSLIFIHLWLGRDDYASLKILDIHFLSSHSLLIREGGFSLYNEWRYRWKPSGASSPFCQKPCLLHVNDEWKDFNLVAEQSSLNPSTSQRVFGKHRLGYILKRPVIILIHQLMPVVLGSVFDLYFGHWLFFYSQAYSIWVYFILHSVNHGEKSGSFI